MSGYTLLLLVNLPFILAGILGAITQYKLNKFSRRRMLTQVFLWLAVFIGLLLSQSIYTFLFSNNLTQTEPLSLFDVVQITAIVFLAYIVNRSRMRLYALERRFNDLHQELSIQLSDTPLAITKDDKRK